LEILKRITAIAEFSNYYLVDGTALALQIGHRISIDLDFFGQNLLPKDKILQSIGHISEITALRSSFEDSFNLYLGDLKIDIIRYDYKWIDDFVIQDGIRMCGLKDIAAMKISAVGGRSTQKDFYDIYFLLEKFTLLEMFGFFRQKYAVENLFHYITSLTFFEEADKDVQPKMIEPLKWDTVKKRIIKEIQALDFNLL